METMTGFDSDIGVIDGGAAESFKGKTEEGLQIEARCARLSFCDIIP